MSVEEEIQKIQQQLVALSGSEKKWYKICFGAVDKGARDCTCCHLARKNYDLYTCTGCPIYKSTELSGCRGTPYTFWESLQILRDDKKYPDWQIFDYRSMRAAELEFHYLQDLQSELSGKLQELEMIQEKNDENDSPE